MWQRLPVRVCEAQWTMWQISHRWQNDTKIQCTNSKWTICEACHLRTLATSSSTCSPSIWPGALLLLSSSPSLPLPWPASFPCLRHLTGWPGETLVIVNSFHCLSLPQFFSSWLERSMGRQGRLEEARQSLAWLREGEQYLEEEHEILEVCGSTFTVILESYQINPSMSIVIEGVHWTSWLWGGYAERVKVTVTIISHLKWSLSSALQPTLWSDCNIHIWSGLGQAFFSQRGFSIRWWLQGLFFSCEFPGWSRKYVAMMISLVLSFWEHAVNCSLQSYCMGIWEVL